MISDRDKIIRDYLAGIGSKGGKKGGVARVKKYSKAQLRAWGKMGGRPRKAGKDSKNPKTSSKERGKRK